MIQTTALVLIALPVLLAGYAYLGYPLLLLVLSRFRRAAPPPDGFGDDWPSISITVPVYNERGQIRELLESLLRLDYPRERRQILIVSDASDDGTEQIVEEYRARGVELLRMPARCGKTAAENAAREHLRGEIVVNTDASIRIAPDALKALIVRFADPAVGVASGRDVSMSRDGSEENVGESGYVGYEMWVRDLETRVGGIVGASGCLYAIRDHLHRHPLPGAFSRDFASALTARRFGYRAESVREAVCHVPRGSSLRREYRRKVRTITRGLGTLFHARELLNPLRHGLFGWMLFSHKLCRWLVPWTAVLGVLGAGLLSLVHPAGWWLLGAMLLAAPAAGAGWHLSDRREVPRALAIPTFLFLGNIAALVAWVRALRGDHDPIWEPTRRDPGSPAPPVEQGVEPPAGVALTP